MGPSKLLVIDDEPNIVFTIAETLGTRDLEVISANTAREGLDKFRQCRPDAILLDVRLPDMSGLDAFSRIHEFDPRVPVIIMTAFARTETAIDAMRRGAFEYLVKPVNFTALKQTVRRALEISRLNRVPAIVDDAVVADEDLQADRIIGQSPAMQEVYKTIGRVAPQDATVLILGESGTGKELVARAIYHYSRRSHRPFLTINCAALTESLLESELFGHERGAFTGADHRRIGKFEQVDGGTIFLDEIGDMAPSTQAKALRLLQQQQFERVGGNTTIQTDVRIIAATNRDLGAMVAEGSFRQDLFYRLSGFTIRLPALRERREDVPLLCDYFVNVIARQLGKPVRGFTPEALAILQQHDWPGNVRELYSAVRYAVIHCAGEVLTADCLPADCVRGASTGGAASAPAQTAGGDATPLPDVQRQIRELMQTGSHDIYRQLHQQFDRVVLDEVLRATNGNQVQAADQLGISRTTLRLKIKSLRNGHEGDETPL